MNVLPAAKVVACASLMAIAVLFISGTSGIITAVIVFQLSLLFVSLLAYMLRRSRTLSAERRLADELVESLRYVLFCRSKGMPTASALRLAGSKARQQRGRDILSVSSRRMALGDSLQQSLLRTVAPVPKDLRDSVVSADWSDDGKALGSMISSYGYALENRRARIEESVQRYATINMFLSTVVPSFIVFAFIGSALLSQREGSLLTLSIALLIALPVAYGVCNTMLSRRLFG